MKTTDIITLTVPDSVINKTIDSTVKKYLYTIRNLTYKRTPLELLDNLFMGDFAKNSLFYYLKEIKGKNLIDYDEIRDDNFENPDPGWDIKSLATNRKIEVKSSIVPACDKEDGIDDTKKNLIEKRDIKITASHDNGKTFIDPTLLESDIHVQIYFLDAKTYKKSNYTFEELAQVIINNKSRIIELINIKKYFFGEYFGSSSKKEIINFKENNEKNNIVPTWTFNWTDRVYWKSPIKKAHSINALLKAI